VLDTELGQKGIRAIEKGMTIRRLFVANRGEIAVRIARTATEMGIETVGVFAADDTGSGHVQALDTALPLPGTGPSAYLDAEALVALAVAHQCDAVHPGYGFLSEQAGFAQRCLDAGLVFVGPSVIALTAFGDKHQARKLASDCGVALLPGTGVLPSGASGPDSDQRASQFFVDLPDGAQVMVKAVAGGGGRGMRVVSQISELLPAIVRCRSEAQTAFGDDNVYVERYLAGARHIEVQIIGDGTGAVATLGTRECSVQRRHQKILELAPAPALTSALTTSLLDAAIALGSAVSYQGVGTMEFLVDAATDEFFFMEGNARLQVEHTITEMIFGVDLVALSLDIANGASLASLELPTIPVGCAVQARVNLEHLDADGVLRPSSGTLSRFDLPNGPGIRIDTHAYRGYTTPQSYDSLLAKIIVHTKSPDMPTAMAKMGRALSAVATDGVSTNVGLLQALVQRSEVANGTATTQFLDTNIGQLAVAAQSLELLGSSGSVGSIDSVGSLRSGLPSSPANPASTASNRAGVVIDRVDPLAVLDLGRSVSSAQKSKVTQSDLPDGWVRVSSPLQGTVLELAVNIGQAVMAGSLLAVLESMKMEHEVRALSDGIVRSISVQVGEALASGAEIVQLETTESLQTAQVELEQRDLSVIRPDLQEVLDRHSVGFDENRPAAVAKRAATNQRTARENVADLCDDGSFVEYGAVVVAAQRRRRSEEDLIARTPADGLVGGIGTINAEHFGPETSRCVVASYDYTVLAGTQGNQNHRKKDRLFEVAEQWRLPVVLFAEGGGGRPGDTDGLGVTGLDCLAFHIFGRLSGKVPLVGITSGYCFAGNAALLGCCDVVIATKNSNIGMGGPAMIEGGGLGVFHPSEIGPIDVQSRNGVIDIVVEDEAQAVAAAKHYLSYFQGRQKDWRCADQRVLRWTIPENRLRAYDIRTVVDGVADEDSVLELRRGFGAGMITALARIEGRPVGIVANDPTHLGGAIDAEAADKASRFMQLCDNYDIPLVFLCDTPGFMVGPEAEAAALVRKAGRLFVTSASVTVPFCTIVLRKGYGLGAQAMAGGGFKIPVFTVAWPTGEFGGMGIEGAVKLGYRNELAAIEDPVDRRAQFDTMVDRMYAHGKALSIASHFEIDAVIDPADTRKWIVAALDTGSAAGAGAWRTNPPKRAMVDTW
jgi:acetyl/propionyl-CoA carboxylase alpha subunit/acetyl-CoA carboxylase carboxyltransferase component